MRHRTSRHHLYLLGVLLFLVLPVLDSVAQTIQVQPIQPLQPLVTEEPDDRPGTIPTIDPDADLPTRPSVPTPTTDPRRFTPTPDVPVGVATSTQAPPTEAVEPSPSPETQALEVQTANLTIHKGACPKDDPTSDFFDPYGDHGIQAFIDACPLVTAPIEFDVFGADGFEAHVDTGVGGEVQIGVPAGPLSVSEVLPDGVTVPAVFCFSDKVLAQADAPATFSPFANWEAQPGEQVECWFFNIRDTARFVIVKFACPEGASPISDQLNPWTYCTEELPGTEFVVTDATGEHSDTTTDDSAVLIWDDLQQRDDGTITVREVIPDGYGEPAYFCGPRQRLNVGDELDEYVPSQNGEITLAFTQPGQTVDGMCVVFNTTVGGESGHDITILKLACPHGYDDTGVPFETLVDDCAKFPGLVDFTVSDGGGFSVTEQTINPDLPFALFDNIPAGPITITETVPNGYAPLAVWCLDEYGGDSLTNVASQPLLNGDSIAWDYADGSRLTCVWLNIPTGDAPVGDNTITIHKWRCNVEDTGYSPDWPLDNLLATCDEAMNDVEFTLAAPNGVSTQTTANGMVEWTGVPEGDFSIQETIPEYYDHPVVFCGMSIPNGGGPMVQVDSANGLVEASFGVPGSAYTCHWFNIDLGEYSIRTYKRVCPDDVLYGGSFDHYQTECTVPMPNVTFDVTTGQGAISADTNFAGIAIHSPIPAGPFSIQEVIPTGYGEPIVFCQASAGYGGQQIVEPMEHVDTAGGAFTAEMPQGGHIDCWWFNMPDDTPDTNPGMVEIVKWECPDEPGGLKTADWYMTWCSQKLDGIDFTLTAANGTTAATTVNGVVSFPDVPAGAIGIQETIPAQYGEAAAVCDVNGAWELFPATNGYVSLDLASGQTISCHWFNTNGGPGDITILKRTCPAGYDLMAANAVPKVDCAELTDGIEFTLSGAAGGAAGGVAVTGETVPGAAAFGALEAGDYTITETVPADTAEVFVLTCVGGKMGQIQSYPLSVGNTLDIQLGAGEHIVCHWYNVPEHDGGSVTVVKYTCSTATFVSEVECQIEEGGVTFDLLDANDAVIATATTDAAGRIAWTGLAPGDYWLAEHDGEWCRISATPSEGGDSFGVNDGQETIVKVWNCGGEPGTPGDTPTKYPNTGVGSASALPLAWQQQAAPQVPTQKDAHR